MFISAPDISLPRGVTDFLPDSAARINRIESEIRRVFRLWGFRRIITPKLEYEDVMSIGMAEELKGKTYRFDDRQTGKLLALPPDITPQIARIVATRLKNFPLPHRICYSGRVLRQTETQAGQNREIFQSGVELIGLDSPEADAEMVAMAIEILTTLNINDFKVDLGHVEFCRAILSDSGLSGKPLADIRIALSHKDRCAVEKIAIEAGLSDEVKREIMLLPRLFGGREVLGLAESSIRSGRALDALRNLKETVHILDIHGVGDYLTIDLGEMRGLDYHTGITFESFIPGLGEPVCSGGRYDRLMGMYGFPAPATGLTFNVLNLLQAIERAPEYGRFLNTDFLLLNMREEKREALEIARILRSRNYSVARDIIRRPVEDSIDYARWMQIGFMLLIDRKPGIYEVVRVSDGLRKSFSREELDGDNFLTFIKS